MGLQVQHHDKNSQIFQDGKVSTSVKEDQVFKSSIPDTSTNTSEEAHSLQMRKAADRYKSPVNRLRLVTDIVMLISFIILGITGILKMPFLYEPLFDFFQKLNFTLFSYIHDGAGGVFTIAVILHLIVSRRRFAWLMHAKRK